LKEESKIATEIGEDELSSLLEGHDVTEDHKIFKGLDEKVEEGEEDRKSESDC